MAGVIWGGFAAPTGGAGRDLLLRLSVIPRSSSSSPPPTRPRPSLIHLIAGFVAAAWPSDVQRPPGRGLCAPRGGCRCRLLLTTVVVAWSGRRRSGPGGGAMPDLFAITDGACSGNPGPPAAGAPLLQAQGRRHSGARNGALKRRASGNTTTTGWGAALAAIPALGGRWSAPLHHHHRDRQWPMVKKRRDQAGFTAGRRGTAGKTSTRKPRQERGSRGAAFDEAAGRAPGDVGMGQGPCRPPRERNAGGRSGRRGGHKPFK